MPQSSILEISSRLVGAPNRKSRLDAGFCFWSEEDKKTAAHDLGHVVIICDCPKRQPCMADEKRLGEPCNHLRTGPVRAILKMADASWCRVAGLGQELSAPATLCPDVIQAFMEAGELWRFYGGRVRHRLSYSTNAWQSFAFWRPRASSGRSIVARDVVVMIFSRRDELQKAVCCRCRSPFAQTASRHSPAEGTGKQSAGL